MKVKPRIKTAIPKHRYRLGEFNVTTLGEIVSADTHSYRYILAVVREGEPEPGMYLTCEPNPEGSGVEGAYAMRLMMQDGAQYVAGSDDWRDLDTFTQDGLQMTQRLLNLTDEQPYRLL